MKAQSQTITRASLLLALAGVAGAQTSIDVTPTSNGASTVFVLPGDSVPYEINAQLGGDASEGLAMFAFDLSFSGGDLTQATEPAAGPLLQFISPLGVNNPEGYGGTVRNGDLLQIGGAMNTINNQFAPSPSGIVETGVGNGAAIEVASGSLTAPMTPGTYQLAVSNVFANALDNQDPSGFWHVRGAQSNASTPLTVEVLECGPTNYCVGKVNSLGCTAAIAGTGTASVSGASAATITATDVVNRQNGLFVWSRLQGSSPLFGGTLCVGQPLTRIFVGASGGGGAAGTNCDGTYSMTIDATFLANAGLMVGETFHGQFIYRDPAHPDMTGASLTDGIRFSVCP